MQCLNVFFCLLLCFAFFVFGGEKLFLLLLFFFFFNKLSVGGIHALGDLYQSAPLTTGQGRRAKKEKYTIV